MEPGLEAFVWSLEPWFRSLWVTFEEEGLLFLITAVAASAMGSGQRANGKLRVALGLALSFFVFVSGILAFVCPALASLSVLSYFALQDCPVVSVPRYQ